jgi:TM2 domain-containing membrane protein YozV
MEKSPKSWITTLLLCWFLGYLGIHRFYTGKTGTGILMLLTGGVFGIMWCIDFWMIVFGAYKDAQGLPVKR